MSVTTLYGVDVKVEIAQGADPDGDASSWTWTDITAKILAAGDITITRGQASDRVSNIDPMKCTFQVDNTAGDFTPGNRGGAYWPYMQKNLPLKVSVFNSTLSVWVTQFLGFMQELPTEFPVGRDSGFVSASVTAAGRWQRVAQRPAYRSFLTETIAETEPYGYWPLTDSAKFSNVSQNPLPDAVAGGWGGFTYEYPDVTFGQQAGKLPGLLPDKMGVPGGVPAVAQFTGMTTSATDGTAVCLMSGDPAWPAVNVRFMTLLDTTEIVWQLYWNTATSQLEVYRAGVLVQSGTLPLNGPLIVRWDYATASTTKLRVGGDFIGSTYSGTVPTFTQAVFGQPEIGYSLPGLSHVAVWNRGLTNIEVQAIKDAPVDTYGLGLPSKGTASLIQLASLAGYPEPDMLLESLDEGYGWFGLSVGGMTPVGALQAMAASAPGHLFEGVEGELVHQGYRRRLGRSPWLSLDMDDDDVLVGVTLAYDDKDLGNDVTVNQTNVSARVVDAVSARAVGSYPVTVESPAESSSSTLSAADYASYMVQQFGTMRTRLAGVVVDLRANTALRGSWLRQQIRNRANLARDDFDSTFPGMVGVTNCTVTQDTTSKAFTGANSSKVTVTGAGAWTAQQDIIGSSMQPVTPGQTWSGSFYVRTAVTARSVSAQLRWYTSGNVFISATSGTASNDSTTVARRTVTGVAPAGAAWVAIAVNGTNGAAAEIHYVSNRQLETGSTANTYVDGAQSGAMWLAQTFSGYYPSYQYADPIGELVRIANPPAQMGAPSVDLFVEGYTQVIGVDKWRVQFQFSNAANMPYLFTLEDSTAGHLDCDGQTVNTLANAGATSVSIATAAGKPLLSTTAGDYPVDLRVDGRKVTATACSGASSPQTLTVSALASALPAGASVELWQPYVLTF